MIETGEVKEGNGGKDKVHRSLAVAVAYAVELPWAPS